MNRDPIGVDGGINIYNSVSNNMVNGFSGRMSYSGGMSFYNEYFTEDFGVDTWGLWTGKREKDDYAIFTSEDGDTIEALINNKSKLNSDDWQNNTLLMQEKYTDLYGGKWKHDDPNLSRQPLCPGQKVALPNTILVYQGEIGAIENGVPGNIFGVWDRILRFVLKDEYESGYKIELRKTQNFQDDLKNYSFLRKLAKVSYRGHGANFGTILKPVYRGTLAPGKPLMIHPKQYTSYGIEELLLFACGSLSKLKNARAKWQSNVSIRGEVSGYEGSVTTFSVHKLLILSGTK